MKITRKTPLILYDIPQEKYITGSLESMTIDQMPVCTRRNFSIMLAALPLAIIAGLVQGESPADLVDDVCKLYEKHTDNIRQNPMYQDEVNWYAIENAEAGHESNNR